MRLTITLDEDVAAALRPLMKRGQSSAVVNELLRKALGIEKIKRVELKTFNAGLMPGIDPTSLNKLADELALEEDLLRLERAEWNNTP